MRTRGVPTGLVLSSHFYPALPRRAFTHRPSGAGMLGFHMPPVRAGMQLRDYFSFSSSILMRRDFRNFRSWSLILNSGLVERVVTREVLSEVFSPCLLTPMVASSTKKMS